MSNSDNEREVLGRASELASWVGGELEGADLDIYGVGSLSSAGPGELAFVESVVPEDCGAGVLLTRRPCPGVTCIVVPEPKAAFAMVLERWFPEPEVSGIHPTAVVHPSAQIAATAWIGPYVVVARDCVVGEESTLHPHVVLYAGTRIGRNVVIHAGTVIGADGFSYVPGADGLRKVPHIGRVRIDDGVEIGANSCVDRAFLDDTSIGRGTKIDNLVQVGHNSRIGQHAVLAAQTGLSGSVRIGDGAMLGGQVGVADHVRIGTETQVGAKAGVSRSLADSTIYLGKFPAQEARSFRRVVGALRKLPELWLRIRSIEETLERVSKAEGERSIDKDSDNI